jgi:hypothetical protein
VDRETIIRRIRGLVAKSESVGSTEAEAASFAEKAAELMARYELDEADLATAENRPPRFDIGQDAFFENGKHTPKVWFCCWNIERLCRVKMVIKRMGDMQRIMVYGDAPDREMARYLLSSISAALEIEYRAYSSANRGQLSRNSKPSFQTAMVSRVNRRIGDIVASRDRASNSRAIVVVDAKSAAVADYVCANVGKLGKTRKSTLRVYDHDAVASGRSAGDRVNLNRPIESHKPTMIG